MKNIFKKIKMKTIYLNETHNYTKFQHNQVSNIKMVIDVDQFFNTSVWEAFY